jgi:hypothetical protein
MFAVFNDNNVINNVLLIPGYLSCVLTVTVFCLHNKNGLICMNLYNRIRLGLVNARFVL